MNIFKWIWKKKKERDKRFYDKIEGKSIQRSLFDLQRTIAIAFIFLAIYLSTIIEAIVRSR